MKKSNAYNDSSRRFLCVMEKKFRVFLILNNSNDNTKNCESCFSYWCLKCGNVKNFSQKGNLCIKVFYVACQEIQW